jgi:hypothetical protein
MNETFINEENCDIGNIRMTINTKDNKENYFDGRVHV